MNVCLSSNMAATFVTSGSGDVIGSGLLEYTCQVLIFFFFFFFFSISKVMAKVRVDRQRNSRQKQYALNYLIAEHKNKSSQTLPLNLHFSLIKKRIIKAYSNYA